MVATEVAKMYAAEAKKRQAAAGGDRKSEDYKKSVPVNLPEPKKQQPESENDPPKKSRENESAAKAGKVVGVSEKSVRQAKKLKESSPDLAERVKTGEVSLNKAVKQAKEQEQAKELETPETEPNPEKIELVSEPVKKEP